MAKLYIIDGNSLLFRAYYATSYKGNIMTTSKGEPTNALFAFSNMLNKILLRLEQGDALFVGFDADGHTFRKAEFKNYKANRKPAPQELIAQFAPTRELLDSLSILHYEQHGIEADDICGTLAKKGKKEGFKVHIFTSDKDYLQLIEEGIEVEILKKGLSETQIINEKNMVELFGFPPLRMIDYKALAGDSSDNLPGIPGIGEKKAVSLIQEYGSFEDIVRAAPNIKGATGAKIIENAELGRECYKLATILTDEVLPFSPSDCLYHGYDPIRIDAFCRRYELKSLLGNLPSNWKKNNADEGLSFEEVEAIPEEALKASDAYIYLEAKEGEYHLNKPLGASIYIDGRLYHISAESLLNDEKFLDFLADPASNVHAYSGKPLVYFLARNGHEVNGLKDDLLIASYLADSSLKASPESVYLYFGKDVYSDDPTTSSLLKAKHLIEAINNARQQLASIGAKTLYEEIEIPLVKVLGEMEAEGFPLDEDSLTGLGEGFANKRDEQKALIEGVLGPINPNSAKQLSAALYGENGIISKKPGGSTSSEVLLPYRERFPLIDYILTYRKYAKLYSTYVEGLLPYREEDGKIHTYFNQAQTSTGRLSSSSPNLQNITVRDEEGKSVRKSFYYPDNTEILSLDYSQIELRVLAHMSHCKDYIEVFKNDRDVHSETARRLYPLEEVTSEHRRKAKAVNFAIIYGSTVYGLSEQIGGSLEEAKRIIEGFYGTYPEIKDYLDKVYSDAFHKGYVATLLGRRRYLKDINSPVYSLREAAKRAALNAPIQGSAADILKLAMVKCAAYIKEEAPELKMVLTIHDEILFAGKRKDLEKHRPHLVEIMENAYPLEVPLKVEGGIGKDWASAKE